MHLACGYIHPYWSAGGRRVLPRARLLPRRDGRFPDGDLFGGCQQPRRIDHQLGGDRSSGVIRTNRLPTPCVWIERWPDSV